MEEGKELRFGEIRTRTPLKMQLRPGSKQRYFLSPFHCMVVSECRQFQNVVISLSLKATWVDLAAGWVKACLSVKKTVKSPSDELLDVCELFSPSQAEPCHL